MPIYKIYRNLDQMVLGRFLFMHFWCRLPKWPEPLARPGAFKQRALRLSQVSKMLLQISGQISAHCSSHLSFSSGPWSRREIRPKTICDWWQRSRCELPPKLLSDWRQRSLPSCSKIRSKTLSDRRQRSLSDHCHRAAKQVLLVWYRQRVLGSLPRIPEVALPLRSVDNKAAILSYPKGQSIIRWYYELNQGVNHEHSCVFKIWSDQELNSWPIHLAGQHCDYSTLSGIAIHSHVVNFLFKGNDLRLICMQTAPAII